ncbi:MAG: rRNA ((967)-C(5))-methyltransferase [Paucimonas sp.]|nr:rRNA ((967)-C(5))-methyltransferase [Paucimonas sp.]
MTRPALPHDSLAFALACAASAVADVRTGTSLPQALSRVVDNDPAAMQQRGAIQDISYRAMRQTGRANKLLSLLAQKPPRPELLAALLVCALSLLCDDADSQAYDDFTVVNQAVEAANALPETRAAKNFVNAVLRRFLRERASLMAEACKDESAQWNYPAWWINALRRAYPAQWQSILQEGNRMPPLTLRVNRRRISRDAYLTLLADKGISAKPLGNDAVRLEKPVPVSHLPAFADGCVSVQDAAAQLAASLLDLHDGMRVLDACAAPGGKSGHLLETADIDLTAVDSDADRLQRVRDNLQRLSLEARIVCGDAARNDWWDGRLYSRILADVPCTASGIVRRHPDIRWLRKPGDSTQLTTLSAQILDNLWQMLEPNGKLLLVTCSLWPQESEAQAAAFASRHQALRLDAPGQLLPVSRAEEDHDGLFFALFQKQVS